MRKVVNLLTGEVQELDSLPATPPTKAEKQSMVNSESVAYLDKTGWYVERLNDPSSGKAIPKKILNARAAAREVYKDIE